MNRVQDKVCIITGGAQGIGRACVERLADEGGKIAIFDFQAYVAVERSVAMQALKCLSEGKIKGRSLRIRTL